MTTANLPAYPFSQTAPPTPPLQDTPIREFLTQKYDGGCNFGLHHLLRQGCYKLMGWNYDFTAHLKHYVYKQYDQWFEAYAPNKTALRRAIHGRIQKIISIP